MKTELILTKDGSHTLYVPELNEHYHSTNGAIQEAIHVYIDAGLKYCHKKELSVLEIGFGTGLNTILTFREASNNGINNIKYESLELYPIDIENINELNYSDFLNDDEKTAFIKLHTSDWDREISINEKFTLTKKNCDLTTYISKIKFDVVFFDAFAPDIQPELWTKDIFRTIYNSMNYDGILTTYSAKGALKRTLKAVGFTVEQIPGPPGKRQMTRAIKQFEVV